ncbi:hypothetical protein KC19_2G236200 [Ceratodon purpureus]|uniref:Rubredoxin-like domain-containing protein n=1 Tax=Ceratodon purpureus TaxID=3225 RepID=A0A8T0IZE0_CERPU|nr:hypothetical protein KC19_2G236200 [Ceratodon purpureus]
MASMYATTVASGAALLSSGAGADSGLKPASVNSVRFGNGAVAFKRASLAVRAEDRSNAPTSPMTTPPGSDEFPLGVISSSAPLEQGTDKPVGERIAYACQDCGYVYDQQTPFEDVPEDYNCPRKSMIPHPLHHHHLSI